MLEECKILLCLKETNLEVRGVILAKVLECGMHPTDGCDLSVELDRTHARVDMIDDERAAGAE
jgi:hypothetical protein